MSEELLKPMAKVISFYSSRSGWGEGSLVHSFFNSLITHNIQGYPQRKRF